MDATKKSRAARYLEKAKKNGKVQISGLISKDAHQKLSAIKDGRTVGDTLDILIKEYVNINGTSRDYRSPEYKKRVIAKIMTLDEKRLTHREIAQHLNEQQLRTFTGLSTWNRNTVGKLINREKNRQCQTQG